MAQDQGSGATSRTPLAFYDRDTSSLKTSQHSLFEDLTECFVPLPKSGSMQAGVVYEHLTSERPTDASDCSSWLPTPTAHDGMGGAGRTPKREGGDNLRTAVTLLPTPAAGNFNDGESVESWSARKERNKAKGINGNGQGTPLAMAVKLLPTPTATDAKAGGNATANRSDPNSAHHAGTTLTDWAKLQADGVITSLPYEDGEPSWVTLPIQLTSEDD